ncbi:MAG: FecR domain-containing protein [Burkholderiales bacterium]|nr:FecR domain-containing protein [Burkholderiales bacterium]
MRNFVHLVMLLTTLLAFAPAGRAASDPGSPDFVVTVKQGDTLTGLAQQWLADPKRWPELQRHNKIEDPKRLAPGSTLAIPASLLREKPAEVKVISVSGKARKSDITLIEAGDRLREGETIKTEENGYVTIQLVDGSTLRLQSRSDLKLERVRRLPGSDATETRIQLPSGQAEVKFNPGAAKASRFEIRTGFASAAVRGTEFRVGADARGTRSEVTEGTIAFAGLQPNAGSDQSLAAVPIPEGFGSIVDESRKPIAPVRLLAAPALPKEPVFQKAPALSLGFPALEGAVSYRAWLAADAKFQQIFGEAVLSQPEVNFSGLKAGSYVLKVRAIDKYGLEGRDAMVLVGILPDKPVGLQRSGTPASVKTP